MVVEIVDRREVYIAAVGRGGALASSYHVGRPADLPLAGDKPPATFFSLFYGLSEEAVLAFSQSTMARGLNSSSRMVMAFGAPSRR